MKNKGFTLTEFITAIVVSALVILATAVLFVAEYRFRADTNNEVYAAREAKAVMSHMSRTLRFAKPGTVTISTSTLTFTLEGGHLGFAASDTSNTSYSYNSSSDTVYFKLGGGTAYPIAYDITYFNPVWNLAAKNFTIDITAQKGDAKVDLHTVIYATGS